VQRRLGLSLYLQGGTRLLLEVDRNDIRKQYLDTLRGQVVRTLREARITWADTPAVIGNSVEARLREGPDFSTAFAKLRGLSQPVRGELQNDGVRTLEVVDAGGGLVRTAPTDAALLERMRRTIDQSVPIIEKRINELGLAVPTIQRQGTDRIVVEVPGLGDPRRLADILGQTAKLEFRMVDTSMSAQDALQGRTPSESEVLYEKQGDQRLPILVKKQALVEGADLTDAQASFDQRNGEPIVNFKFNSTGARKFGRATQENVGRPFAIVLDNDVISAPVIREPIVGGSGRISNNFTVESANNLAILLRAGALPAKLTVIEWDVFLGAGQI
jgi:preprotein translocase subunit SecD